VRQLRLLSCGRVSDGERRGPDASLRATRDARRYDGGHRERRRPDAVRRGARRLAPVVPHEGAFPGSFLRTHRNPSGVMAAISIRPPTGRSAAPATNRQASIIVRIRDSAKSADVCRSNVSRGSPFADHQAPRRLRVPTRIDEWRTAYPRPPSYCASVVSARRLTCSRGRLRPDRPSSHHRNTQGVVPRRCSW
jgi:hypothetical protein